MIPSLTVSVLLALGAPIQFEAQALDFQHQSGRPSKELLLETMGAGVACGDLDGDGDADLFVTGGAKTFGDAQPPELIFWNEGDRKFSRGDALPVKDGWSMGGTLADYDEDGDLDIYVTSFGANHLLRNDGDRKFTDVTTEAKADDTRWSMGSAWADYDGDGDLDLFVANYVDSEAAQNPGKHKKAVRWRNLEVALGPAGLPGAGDSLFRNNGNGTFTRVEKAAGVDDPNGHYGFQVLFLDLTEDGLPDIYVANDSTPNHFYRNLGNGKFREEGIRSGLAYSLDGKAQAGMGACVGDPDGDGDFDLVVTNFSNDYNSIYRNLGGGFFEDATAELGLRSPTWSYLSWGCVFADFDADGGEDLFIANGHIYPQVDEADFNTSYRQADQVFRWNAKKLVEEKDAGLVRKDLSRGACRADFDADGRMDLAVGVLDGAPEILWNEGPTPAATLRLRLEGTESPKTAVGSVVRAAGRTVPVLAGESFLGSSSYEILIPVPGGDPESLEEIEVRWPSGKRESFLVSPAGNPVRLIEGKGRVGSTEGAPAVSQE